ncbi:MAG: ferric reductase-like transmembrane domain-containing protein [Coriobacteriia bacterium]|nr:ferric reductase-like transmembrane domain-containing protein [Coriobacteriia bacterium]MBN2822816.1 ferric reductase-like transmembrane domain-containing protein [Coriobacteriia bacterium]
MRLIMRGVFWFGTYLTIILAPLVVGVVFFDPGQAASPLIYLADAVGYIALALMATELALVSRLRGVAGAFGIDSLLQFHRQIGIASMAFAVAHPILLVADLAYTSRILVPTAATPWPVTLGTVAFVLAALVVGLSVYRRLMHLSYEVWHTTHGILSVLLIGVAAVHILGVGRFAALPVMRTLLIVYLVFFVGMFLNYRLLRPLMLRSKPWEVVENRREHGQSHTLVLRPVGHDGFRFEPGQFAWIGFGRSPLSTDKHPISFSSNGDIPNHDGTVAFTIKELGDWSGGIVPKVKVGATAWLDGPHGVFTMDREEGAGYVLIGGGVGITPLYSMLQALETRDDSRPVFVFHAANDFDDLTFREELAATAERMPSLTLVTVLLRAHEDWEGERGFVTAETLTRYLPTSLYRHFQYFICGPTPLMDAMEEVLPKIGVPADRIHTERFDMV